MSDIFLKYLFEADDDAPDIGGDDGANDAPDIGGDDGGDDNVPDFADGGGSDAPPDMGFDDNVYGDDVDADDTDETDGEINDKNLGIDDKVSIIMNNKLYYSYLRLIRSLSMQLIHLRDNSDVLYSLSDFVTDMIEYIAQLESNVKAYISNVFSNENYSKNLLFYNKCINLQSLLNDHFDKSLKKGIKGI